MWKRKTIWKLIEKMTDITKQPEAEEGSVNN